MKSSRKWMLGFVASGALLLHADLASYLRNLEGSSPLDAVFFRLVPVGSQSIRMRRPPAETVPALSEKLAQMPSDAELYAYRAWESERLLKFDDAEKDWREYARLAPDKLVGYTALGDFYDRRIRPQQAFDALLLAAAAPRPSKTFERLEKLLDQQALPPEWGTRLYLAWQQRYPDESSVLKRHFAFAVAHTQYDVAGTILTSYTSRFPSDPVFPVQARATLAERRGSIEQALAVYDQSFQPLWPAELIRSYFELLKKTHSLRRFLAEARSSAASRPDDIAPAARLFCYWQQQGNLIAARRALVEYRQRKQERQASWSAVELHTLAALFTASNSHDDAAHAWYTLLRLPGAAPADRRDGIAALASLLLSAPDQPIEIGSGELSMYRDIGAADPHPGFLNGVLSLLLNSTSPASEFAEQERNGISYFHRAKAAELIGLLDREFPDAPQRATLHADLLQAYSSYGVSASVISGGKEFLNQFLKSEERTRVALLMAEAYARQSQTAPEFAVYDSLLQELAGRAGHVPLGAAVTNAAPKSQPSETRTARSPEYARVFDRYLARLVSLKRLPDALALYRQEIQRNPADPGLYERFAGFIEQNKLGGEVETVYRNAAEKFQSRVWYEKLARWYLRQKRQVDFARLADQVSRIFSGSDLERYITGLVTPQMDAIFYRQVNLFANQRFPNNLAFVRNLLTAYSRPATRDNAAYSKLLRNYWYFDADLRQRYFESLSRGNLLPGAIAAVQTSPASPATARWLGEAEAWRGHFEDAAPLLATAAASDPGDVDVVERASAVARSLGQTETAVALAQQVTAFDPRNSIARARVGDIWADRELYDKARPLWNALPSIAPGKPELYLEAATVFWDYYLFDDALRLISDARQRFSKPSLYAYEAGAIYESKRQPAEAIREYVAGALNSDGSSPARSRLMVLATRVAWQPLIEAQTAGLVSAAREPEAAAVSLRTVVLARQERWKDLQALLSALAGRTRSVDLLERIGQEADRNRFPGVSEQVLARQAEVTGDPVDRMRYRLALARQLEDRKELDGARRVMESLYRDNPAVLGVVRATVDFCWRAKDTHRAVELLLEAARRAQPGFRAQFTLEASRKLTETGEPRQARKLLEPLLASEPFQPTYITAMAATYAAAKDDAGLRDFYQAKLQGAAAAQRATLRRGLIPALARLNDHRAAISQYIELIKSFPDDEALCSEAASYASLHNIREPLLAYFAQAGKDSPRDARWPIVTARLSTWFEDYPGAVAAWSRAAALRPDRPELLAARGALEQRLLRFDDALKTYSRLYELAYHNPRWLEAVADIYARQGKGDAAEAALRKAMIEGRPENAANYFNVADRLASFGLLDRARKFAGMGVAAGGEGSPIANRIYAQAREFDLALKNNGAEIGAVAAAFYTPEEKAQLAGRLAKLPAEGPRAGIAEQASLAGLQAQWLYETMLAKPGQETQGVEQQLVELQSRRMQFRELGRQLEAYWRRFPADEQKDRILEAAAKAYSRVGDKAQELRVLAIRVARPPVPDPVSDRYLAVLAGNSLQLLAAASPASAGSLRDRAVTAALAGGSPQLAMQAIRARGGDLPAVWSGAYTGLASLYFGIPGGEGAFLGILGPRTVGEQLGHRVDTARELAGPKWFYYASRLGEYLSTQSRPGVEEYLPALVENLPGHAGAYFDLAESYRELGQFDRAVEEYRHSIELDRHRATAHDRIALALSARNRREEAVASWRLAFVTFTDTLREQRPLPEFWGGVRETMLHAAAHGAMAELKPDIDRLLKLYIQRNGSYMVEPLLEGLFAPSQDSLAAMNHVADLSRSAADPGNFLDTVLSADWLPSEGREVLHRRRIAAAETTAAKARGEERGYLEEAPRRARLQYLEYLLDSKQTAEAAALFAAFSDADRQALGSQLTTPEVRLAAIAGSMEKLIDRYRRSPSSRPQVTALLQAASAARTDGQAAEAQQLLEFVYANALETQDLTAANFLGLAEIRLEQKRVPEAVALLKRVSLVVGQPFENLLPSAELLLKFGHAAEARPFLETRVQAVPWDFTARRLLAEAKGDAAGLRQVAIASQAPYADRTASALALARLQAPAAGTLGSAELDLLARPGPIPPAEAQQPYFFAARLASAAQAPPGARVPLLLAALAERPKDATARLPLFRAALASGNSSVAVAALEGQLEGGIRYQLENEGEVSGVSSIRYYTSSFLPDSGLDLRGSLEVALAMADAYEKCGRRNAVALLLRIAQRLQPSAREAAVVRARLTELDASLQRDRLNAGRRPTVSANLEQDRIVRPRLAKGGLQ